MYKSVRQCTTMNSNGDLASPVEDILAAATARSPPDGGPIAVDARSIDAAIERCEGEGLVPIIAEVKPTSPTSEHERDDDPVALARSMERAGAAAISVLTEPTHFGGTPEDLEAVRSAVDIPVLRKDFVLEERHLDVVAADLVLLIVRFVEDELDPLIAAARDRGFQPLVEVHTVRELQVAIDAGAELIGINNRDLGRLEVDLDTFPRVAAHAPEDVRLVAESGIAGRADVRRMREAGADALLVGSSIMAGDVEACTRALVEAER